MTHRVSLRPEAEDEIRSAAAWYGDRNAGLADRFLSDLMWTIDSIAARPQAHPVVVDQIRKAVLRRSPYVVLFRADETEILVIACYHTRRDPERLRPRL